MRNKILVLYSIIISDIFAIVFWLSVNKLIYNVKMPPIRGFFLILIMTLSSALFSSIFVKLDRKKDANIGVLITKGIFGGFILGVLVGLFGGAIWGLILNVLIEKTYWNSLWLIAKIMLLYYAPIGLIFGAIGYPIIVRKTKVYVSK